MRPARVVVGSQTFSAWVPINQIQNAFQIGLGCAISSGASATYKVQHTFDEPGPEGLHPISISRVTTTATVVDVGVDGLGHGLSVSDNVLIQETGSTNLDGSYAVASIVSATSYTYTVANSGATADQGNAKAHNFRVYDHAIITGQTGRIDGNYAFPIQAVRLNVTTWASGKVELTVLQGMGR